MPRIASHHHHDMCLYRYPWVTPNRFPQGSAPPGTRDGLANTQFGFNISQDHMYFVRFSSSLSQWYWVWSRASGQARRMAMFGRFFILAGSPPRPHGFIPPESIIPPGTRDGIIITLYKPLIYTDLAYTLSTSDLGAGDLQAPRRMAMFGRSLSFCSDLTAPTGPTRGTRPSTTRVSILKLAIIIKVNHISMGVSFAFTYCSSQ